MRWSTLFRLTFALPVAALACEEGTAPLPDYPALALTQIEAGGVHTCGLSADSILSCWGVGENLGRPADSTCAPGRSCSLIAGPVVGGQRFVSFTAKKYWFGGSNCGLTSTGRAYCWGGVGGFDYIIWSSETPDSYPTSLRLTRIASGGLHICGLDLQGQPWCWGGNYFGELGAGVYVDSIEATIEPQAVANNAPFSHLAAGANFSCTLEVPGQARCWGDNTYGQLGSGASLPNICGFYTGDLCEPRPVAVYGGFVYTSLSTGYFHTCGVTSESVYCWGANYAGQLGSYGPMQSCPAGAPPDGPRPKGPCALHPTFVGFPFASGTVPVVTVAAGYEHTCALTSGGTAYCWGRNDHGQLGIGATGDHSSPAPVAGNVRFASLTAGAHHSCGLTDTGDAYCWGSNEHGQLGDGTTTDRDRPVKVRRPD